MIENHLVSYITSKAELNTWFPDATNIHPIEAEPDPGTDIFLVYSLQDRQRKEDLSDGNPLIYDTFDIALVSRSEDYTTLKTIEEVFWDHVDKHTGSFGGAWVQVVHMSQASDRGFTNAAGFESGVKLIEFQLLIRYLLQDV